MGGRAAVSVLLIVASVVLVRFLDQEEYGHYRKIMLIVAASSGILGFGIPQSVYYFVARYPSSSQPLVIRSLVTLGVCGLAGAAAVGATATRLEQVFDVPLSSYLPAVLAYLAMSVPARLTYILPTADQRAQLQVLMLVTLETLRACMLIIVVIATRSLTILLGVLTISVALQLMALVLYLFVRSPEATEGAFPATFRTQLRYAIPLWGATLVNLIRDSGHSFFVAATFTATEFAVYAIGTMRPPLVSHVNEAIGDVMLIRVTQSHEKGDLGEVRRVWFRALHNLALVLIPIFVVLEVYAYDLIVTVFGIDYAASVPVFRVYLLTFPAYVPLLASPMLKATGDIRTHVVADAASFAGTLGTLLVAGRYFGLLGAALSSSLGYVAFAVIALPVVARTMGVRPTTILALGSKAQIAFWSFAASAAPWVLLSGATALVRLLVGLPLSGGLLAAAAWRFGLIEESERELIRDGLGRFVPARILNVFSRFRADG